MTNSLVRCPKCVCFAIFLPFFTRHWYCPSGIHEGRKSRRASHLLYPNNNARNYNDCVSSVKQAAIRYTVLLIKFAHANCAVKPATMTGEEWSRRQPRDSTITRGSGRQGIGTQRANKKNTEQSMEIREQLIVQSFQGSTKAVYNSTLFYFHLSCSEE